MSYNGSGTFAINSTGQPVVSGTTISDTVFNALTADLATGLTNCITRDGQSPATASIPMGGNKITGLASGAAATDAPTLAQVQSSAVQFFTAGGTADVITGTLSPAISAYAAGQTFRFVATGANTTNVTLNLNSLGAKAVTKNGTTALVAGDIPSGKVVTVTYDGTQFQLGEKILVPGAITSSGYTQSTSKLLGRTTASTGAIEEISVGTGLTLSAGSLSASGGITLGTAVAASGTSIDFTGIPSTAKRVTVNFSGVSLSGSANYLIQLGDSGGPEASGYLSSHLPFTTTGTAANGTTGFTVVAGGAALVMQGSIIFSLIEASTNTWAALGMFGRSDAGSMQFVAGSKATSATLDRVRITTSNGTDTFDAGTINISYE